jgi:hypothetical protein
LNTISLLLAIIGMSTIISLTVARLLEGQEDDAWVPRSFRRDDRERWEK